MSYWSTEKCKNGTNEKGTEHPTFLTDVQLNSAGYRTIDSAYYALLFGV